MAPFIDYILLIALILNKGNGAPPPANCGSLTMLKVGNNSYACIPNTCDYDICDPGLGKCNNGEAVTNSQCQYAGVSGNYSGILSYPHGVSTEYCTLSNGAGCAGGACGNGEITKALLDKYGVTGIAAVNPILFGLDENRNNNNWGQGCTTNNNICYYIVGPDGNTANVMITDRCAGYCNCDGGNDYNDCGRCVLTTGDPSKIHPNCPCIGTDGDMYKTCCGNDAACKTPLNAECDWYVMYYTKYIYCVTVIYNDMYFSGVRETIMRILIWIMEHLIKFVQVKLIKDIVC